MAIPNKFLRTSITKPDGSIFCRRCDRKLGEIGEDGQYLEIGNVRLFGRYQKYFCVCGSVYNFSEKDLGGHSIKDFPPATHQILNELGRDYNENYLRAKHQKHDHEHELENDD